MSVTCCVAGPRHEHLHGTGSEDGANSCKSAYTCHGGGVAVAMWTASQACCDCVRLSVVAHYILLCVAFVCAPMVMLDSPHLESVREAVLHEALQVRVKTRAAPRGPCEGHNTMCWPASNP